MFGVQGQIRGSLKFIILPLNCRGIVSIHAQAGGHFNYNLQPSLRFFRSLGQVLMLRGFVPVLLDNVAQSSLEFCLRQVLEALLDARANADTTKDVSASASTIRTFQESTNKTPKEYQYNSEGVFVKPQGSLPTESLRYCFYCSSGRAYS